IRIEYVAVVAPTTEQDVFAGGGNAMREDAAKKMIGHIRVRVRIGQAERRNTRRKLLRKVVEAEPNEESIVEADLQQPVEVKARLRHLTLIPRSGFPGSRLGRDKMDVGLCKDLPLVIQHQLFTAVGDDRIGIGR